MKLLRAEKLNKNPDMDEETKKKVDNEIRKIEQYKMSTFDYKALIKDFQKWDLILTQNAKLWSVRILIGLMIKFLLITV